MPGVVKPVRWPEAELAIAVAAATAEGLTFSAWVRRACVRQAELERSLVAQAVAEEPAVVLGDSLTVAGAQREFRPDFGSRLKK